MGREIFNRYCASCHNKLVRKGDILDLTDDLWIHGDTDGKIFIVISEGVPGTAMRGSRMSYLKKGYGTLLII